MCVFACGICVKLQINYRRCIAIKTCFGMGRALITVLILVFLLSAFCYEILGWYYINIALFP